MRALVLALALVGCGGNNDDAHADRTIDPPDCVNHPEACK